MTQAIQKTVIAWWQNLIILTILNVVWLALQLLIVTAAPATAAFYGVANSMAAGDSISWEEFWEGFRRHFWKATRWGLLQVVFYFIVVFNFAYYAQAGSVSWGLIKIIWGGVALVWTILQLLYWPLILEAEDQSIRNTLHNALTMLWLHPLSVLGLALITVVIIAACVLTAFLMGLIMMPFVTLMGTFVARDLLRGFRDTQQQT